MDIKIIKYWSARIGKKLSKYNYFYDAMLSATYNGDGFYINHNYKVCNPIRTYGYDKHWAYGGSLLHYVFPLSSELQDEETELGIYCVEFNYMNPRYDDFYYNLYKNMIDYSDEKGKKQIYLTNIDWPIFNDLWDTDAVIVDKRYFKHIGHLDILEDLIYDGYKFKKENKQYKKEIEACFYGLFAKMLKNNCNSMTQKLEYKLAKIRTRYDDVRNKKVPIAIFQTAYLRNEEWQLFKKYKDHVLYMNTDSIYADCPLDINTSDKIGEYGIEKDVYDKIVYFIRRNAYVSINDDKTICKSVIGGCINGGDITIEKLEKLNNKEEVDARTIDADGNIINIKLKPRFKYNASGQILLN